MPHNTFFNTDPSAPQLQQANGQLVALLDECLVNGGTNFSITSITRSGSLATATTAANLLSPSQVYPYPRRLTLSGSTQSEYNGTFLVSVTAPDRFTFTVSGTPATPGTGTPLAKTTALGWTIEFTAANRRVYKQGAGSNGFFLDVDDRYGTYALVRGYEAMSGLSAGSNPFPTAVQVALNAGCWIKSNTATNRFWCVQGNEKFVRFMPDCLGAIPTLSGGGVGVYEFGDFPSEIQGDVYNTTISLSVNVSALASTIGATYQMHSTTSISPNRFFVRAPNGIGAAIGAGVSSLGQSSNPSGLGAGGSLTYPALNGGLYISPILTHQISNYRGTVPGIFDILHARPLTHLDIWDGTGAYAGMKFQAMNTNTTGGGNGQFAMLLSPW